MRRARLPLPPAGAAAQMGIDSTWAQGAKVSREQVTKAAAYYVSHLKEFNQLFGMDGSRTKNTEEKPAHVAVSKLKAWFRRNTPCILERERKRKRLEGKLVDVGDYELIADPKVEHVFPLKHMRLPGQSSTLMRHGDYRFVDEVSV